MTTKRFPGNPPMEEVMAHYGIKGMKWGVRKERASKASRLTGLGPDHISRVTKDGTKFELSKENPRRLDKGLASVFGDRYVNSYNNGAAFKITGKGGEKIGECRVTKKSADELNLIWLGIEKSQRGNGYASETMKAAATYGRKAGFKKLTLEVPGNSPDARHIYEKMGFKVTKEASEKEKQEDFLWGGLTEMEYVFSKNR